MASISQQKNGRRIIQFVATDGRRKSIRLGKISQRNAEAIKTRVEALNAAQISGQPIDGDTAKWVSSRDEVMSKKLASVGLIAERNSLTLGPFIDNYIKSRTDLKPRTVVKFKATKDYLNQFLGKNRNLRDISPGDADKWRVHLLAKPMAENTVRKHTQIAKQFFTSAVREKLIDVNRFTDLKSTTQANPERFHFVSREDAQKILDACPDAQWRLIFALSRFGGLRCPSEHLAITWEDVDWENNRLRIPSPKTEHHSGGTSRVIPIFPELRPYLEDVQELSKPREMHVITRYRDTNINLRTMLLRIIRRAGLEHWPKLFQNLRSTRQTELAEEFPAHVVCAWIGNTKAVAAKHYLQTTDEHFQKALQNPVQQTHVEARKDSHEEKRIQQKSVAVPNVATSCEFLPEKIVAEEGLEPPTRGL